MPPNIISASLLLCERVLSETDGVQSAMRVIDLFLVDTDPQIPERLKFVQMYVFLVIKSHNNDDSPQVIRFEVTKPSGEVKIAGEPVHTNFKSAWAHGEGIAGGTSVVMKLTVTGEELGTHFIRAFLNDEEIAANVFTIAPLPSPPG